MAYTLGKPGRRAWRTALLWFTAGSLSVGLPMWGIGHLPQIAHAQGWVTPTGEIFPPLILGTLLLTAVFGYLGVQWLYRGRHHEQVSRAQSEVADLLSTLPNTYVVLHHYHLPEGLLDHVVIGPTGCFAMNTHNAVVPSHADSTDPIPWIATQATKEHLAAHQLSLLAKSLQRHLCLQGLQGRLVQPLLILTTPASWARRDDGDIPLMPVWDLLPMLTADPHQLTMNQILTIQAALTGTRLNPVLLHTPSPSQA